MNQPHVELRALGTLGLTVGGADAHGVLSRPKHAALLLYLTLAVPRAPQRRDALVALLWPELGDGPARAALSKAVHHLRRELGDDAIASPRVEELAAVRVDCDVLRFEDAVARGDHALALSLYAGDFLAGFHVRDAAEFMEWVERRRRALRRDAIECAIKASSSSAGNATAALAAARRGREIDPLDERVVRALLALLESSGDRTAAVREYDEFAAHLRRELDVDPSPETRSAIDAIKRRSAPRAVRRQTPSPAPAPRASSPAVKARAGSWAWMTRRTVAVAVVLVALGTTASWAIARRGNTTELPVMSATRVAVMPFEVLASREHAYLADGIATLLAEQLDGAGALTSVSPRQVLKALDSSRIADGGAAEVSRRFGAGLVLEGKVVEASGELHVTAWLTDRATGREVHRGSVSGRLDQVFDLLSQIAVRVATAANLDDADARLAAIEPLTQSPAAVRALLEGERAYRVGSFEAAAQAFRRAVEADSGFALGYWRLAMVSFWNAQPSIAQAAIDRASALAPRLSPTGREHVRALRLYSRNEFTPALAAYEQLRRRNPSDADAWVFESEIRHHEGSALGIPMSSVAESWRRVLALEPGNASALLHLLVIHARDGDRAAFERDAAQLRPQDLDANRRVEVRALRAHAFGDSAARRALRADLQTIQTANLEALFQRVGIVTPDLRQVDENFTTPLIATRGDPLGVRWLIQSEVLVAAAQGDLATMQARLDSLGSGFPDYGLETEAETRLAPHLPVDTARVRVLLSSLRRQPVGPGSDVPAYRNYLRVALALRLGDVDAANVAHAELQRVNPAPAEADAVRRLERLSRASILAHGNRAEEALRVLGPPALPRASWSPTERLLRAELHARLGQSQLAHQWYETFPAIGMEDFGLLRWATQRNAELYEREGNRAAAQRLRGRVGALAGR